MLARDELRWLQGETMARATRTEIVGMGFQVRERGAADPFAPFERKLLWVELQNMSTDPVGEFEVPAEYLRTVLLALQSRYGEGNVRAHALWHSHSRLAAPSPFDVVYFPEYLSVGVIYHEPSGRSVLYDGDGLIPDPQEIQYQLATSFGTTH